MNLPINTIYLQAEGGYYRFPLQQGMTLALSGESVTIADERGTFVFSRADSDTSVLGEAVLGQAILGQ